MADIRKHKLLAIFTVVLGTCLILIASLASGCALRSEPVGWSGVACSDSNVFVASIEGRLFGFNKQDGKPLWQSYQLDSSKDGVAIYSTPAVYQDLVYLAGYNGRVSTISIESGYRGLVFPDNDSLEPIIGGLTVSGGNVFFGCNDGKVYCLNTDELHKEWEFQTDDRIWSTPVISEGTVFVSSFDNNIYALDASNGTEIWHFEAEGAFVSTPLIQDDTVYAGCFDRHVYALDATNGTLKWRSEVEADKWFWSQVIAHNDVIYAPNLDGKIYILNADNGYEVADPVELDSPISSSPVIIGDNIIVASQQGNVYAIDTGNNRTGSPIFDVAEDEVINAPLCASDSIIYIHAQSPKHDKLYAFNTETRREVWAPVSLS